MHHGQIVFAQLMEFFPQHAFRQRVARYQGNYRTWAGHYQCMLHTKACTMTLNMPKRAAKPSRPRSSFAIASWKPRLKNR